MLQMGVFGSGALGGALNPNQAPAGTGGPPQAGLAAFGTVADGSNGRLDRVARGTLVSGGIAGALLLFMWWSLPR